MSLSFPKKCNEKMLLTTRLSNMKLYEKKNYSALGMKMVSGIFLIQTIKLRITILQKSFTQLY